MLDYYNMVQNNIKNDNEEIQIDHTKISLENVVNESGNGSPLNSHLHSAGIIFNCLYLYI